MQKLGSHELDKTGNVDTVMDCLQHADDDRISLFVCQVLLQQVRQLWLSRGAILLVFNQNKIVNAAVRSYTTADSEFKAAMGAFRKESKALGITANFEYLSSFMSLRTICQMEVASSV